MSREDYVAIASAIASVRPLKVNLSEYAQWERDCMAIANALADDNPRFDHDRFLKACKEDK